KALDYDRMRNQKRQFPVHSPDHQSMCIDGNGFPHQGQQYMNSGSMGPVTTAMTTATLAGGNNSVLQSTKSQRPQRTHSQRESSSANANASAGIGVGGSKTKIMKDKKASVVLACEHSLSSQIAEHFNVNQLTLLEQLTDHMAA